MLLKVYLPSKVRISLGKNEGRHVGAKQEIHYIGGSEILPAPLDIEEENEAIRGMIVTIAHIVKVVQE